jgi:hypothetical protein
MPQGGDPSPDRSVLQTADPGRSWLRTNLEHSFPFLLTSAVLVGTAAWLGTNHTSGASPAASLWVLLAALGITVGGGGVALTLVEDPEAPSGLAPGTEYVLVRRSEWEAWKSSQAPSTSHGSPKSPLPAASQPPTRVEPVVATQVPRAPAIDPTVVSRASEQLLAGAPARSSPPTQAVAGSGPSSPSSAPSTIRQGSISSPAPASPPPPVVPPRTTTTPTRPMAPVPNWQEEPIRELESVLTELGGDAPHATWPGSVSPPSSAAQRCTCCGAAMTAYSEQACVVCGRPLCDNCLEKSVFEGRPSICTACATPVRHP